ncbi:MAG: DUF3568 family protein, partial [Rhodospirillales bacterium]
MPNRNVFAAVVLTVTLAATAALQGCAGAGLTVLGAGAGTAAGTGVNHALSGVAYKTFALPSEEVRNAVLEALTTMQIKITGDEKTEAGRAIAAHAANREIAVEIEQVTPRGTRVRLSVEEGALFKNAATATEIMAQTIAR